MEYADNSAAFAGGRGRRLLPHVIDSLAQDDPEHILYSIPLNGRVEEGFEDITARRFANAVNRLAWWLESTIGRGTKLGTIAYIGPQDLRYGIVLSGFAKAGYKALFLSPRNSTEAQLSLLEATQCKVVALPKERSEATKRFVEQARVLVIDVPELALLLDEAHVEHHPYDKLFGDAIHEPFFVLHTSGSTALPKPIFTAHGAVAVTDSISFLPSLVDGTRPMNTWRKGLVFFNTFPAFHLMGVGFTNFLPPFHHLTAVLGPAVGPPSLDVVEQVFKHKRIDAWSLVPPMVEGLAHRPALLKKFESVEWIMTGGGQVAYQAGLTVSRVVKIRNMLGSTETHILGSWDLDDPADFAYFKWHPQCGIDLREIAPGLYELWVVRVPDVTACARYQAVFHTFPELDEYNMKDLYVRHPDPAKHELWYCVGRSDDVIVLGNGEKIQPIDMERAISTHPEVAGCLIVGSTQQQGAALIELKDTSLLNSADKEIRQALLDSIWATVQKANANSDAHAQIHRSHIMFANPAKPFLHTDKGTIKRRATVNLYQAEIDDFYAALTNELVAEDTLGNVDMASMESIRANLQILISRILKMPKDKAVNYQDDIFAAGLDSLNVLRVLAALHSSLGSKESGNTLMHSLRPTFVYSHPTIEALSRAFYNLANSHNDVSAANGSEELSWIDRDIAQANLFLDRYIADLPQASQRDQRLPQNDKVSVILTGSTGSIGSYLLEQLVSLPNVKQITCLNRAEDGGRRKQVASATEKGLTPNWPESKVQFLHAKLSESDLGLSELVYEELSKSTSLIIHGQWPVNFNWGLASFEPYIAGVRNLVNFSASSQHHPRIFFISSISSTMQWKGDNSAIPEAAIADLSIAAGSGYGLSKLISERILGEAARISNVPATICRVGQVSGPILRGTKGLWNPQEWLPSLIATSKALNVLPLSLEFMDRVDWIPVDLLSSIIVELTGVSTPHEADGSGTEHKNLTIYHAVNPRTTTWKVLAPSVLTRLGKQAELVTFQEWLSKLRTVDQQDMQRNGEKTAASAGVKLLEFFEGFGGEKEATREAPQLDVTEALANSKTFRELQPVSEAWIALWMEQWGL